MYPSLFRVTIRAITRIGKAPECRKSGFFCSVSTASERQLRGLDGLEVIRIPVARGERVLRLTARRDRRMFGTMAVTNELLLKQMNGSVPDECRIVR